MGVDLSGNNKPWELSLYELNRKPQPLITDDTEIAVKPRSLQSELMCPICLDMLKNTMTTKECLHRFCNECICTALRSGNKECPTCRKKLVSRRSLRPDPNFDMLISKIYPSREEYEKHQEMINSRLGRSIGIEENGQPTRKNSIGRKSNGVNQNHHYQDTTNADTTEAESCASSTSYQDNNQQEVELVFKPLTQDVDNPENSSLIHTRFLKTTTNATVDHLIKYLSMRHFLETNPNNCENNQELRDTETSLFTIYKATGPGEYRPLQGQSTLDEIKQKFWKSDKPLELYYGYNVLTQ